MGYGIGSLLAVAVSIFARAVGLDRDRAFYTTVLIVVGAFYVLFAVVGGTAKTILIETAIMMVFVAAAVAGFKADMRIVAGGLIGHGLLDIFHGGLVTNPGVPEWWPPFCMAYDVVAGAILFWLLAHRATIQGNNAARRAVG